jgi:hypothetical protein
MNKPTLKQAAAALGSLGGRAGRGKSKARTTEQARAAGRKGAAVRWGKRKRKEPTRACPACLALVPYQPLIEANLWETQCPACNARLVLEWDRIETSDGPEDSYWFELKPKKDAPGP